jgi:Putative transposase
VFFGDLDGLHRREAFAAHLAPLKKKNWFVYAKSPFTGPEAVLAYLAGYTHRVAISNSRLVGLDERGITFRYKDYRSNGRERFRTMTLAPGEFIRRFLLHVLAQAGAAGDRHRSGRLSDRAGRGPPPSSRAIAAAGPRQLGGDRGVEARSRQPGLCRPVSAEPHPSDGNMIKAAWLGRYNTVPDRKNLQRVVLSCELLRITDYCQERVSLFSEPSRIADHCVLGPSNSALNSGPTMPRDCPE